MKPKEIPPENQDLFREIGKRVKELRKGKGLTYVQLAEQIGMSRNAYNQMELGIRNFQLITLLEVLKFHGIGLNEFFKDL